MPSELEQQALDYVQKVRTDPIWFFEEILNIKTNDLDRKRGQNWDLDEWYREMVEAVADIYRKKVGLPTVVNHEGLNKITVRAMHGPGKTFGVAGIMHWFNTAFYGTIVCTAPKEKQLRTRLWPAFRKIRSRAGKAYSDMITMTAAKIIWNKDDDWAAHAETASEPENLAGYHDDFLLFIVDEATGMKEEMFPVIEGAVSTGSIVVIILIGNPTKNIGTFYDSHMREAVARNYYKIHVDLAKTSRVSLDWVKQMEQKYGKDSPIVKIRCRGEFADGGKNQLYALQWLVEAKDAEWKPDGSFPKLRVSVDVSDGGEDETVITVTREYESFDLVLKMRRFSFPTAESPILSAEAAAAMFEEFDGDIANGDDLVVDGLGVGAGCAGHLIRGVTLEDRPKKQYPVVVYKGGSASDDQNRWRNRRVQTHLVARDQLMEKNVVFHDECFESDEDWEDFQAQMCSIQSKEGSESKEDLVTKKEMTSGGIKSPDMAESFIMKYATQAPADYSGIEIEVLGESEMSGWEGAI